MFDTAISVRQIHIDDIAALWSFEQENRAWFEQWVPPRPEGYFERDTFGQTTVSLINEAGNGTAYMHLILDNEEQIIGRINLLDITGSTANLGYRIGKKANGRGVASQACKNMLNMAASDYELREIRAESLDNNPASIAVLVKCGFTQSASHRMIKWQGHTVKMRRFRKIL